MSGLVCSLKFSDCQDLNFTVCMVWSRVLLVDLVSSSSYNLETRQLYPLKALNLGLFLKPEKSWEDEWRQTSRSLTTTSTNLMYICRLVFINMNMNLFSDRYSFWSICFGTSGVNADSTACIFFFKFFSELNPFMVLLSIQTVVDWLTFAELYKKLKQIKRIQVMSNLILWQFIYRAVYFLLMYFE